MRLRIGPRRPSQPLKSPTTETRRACGAQTAKLTPATPSWSMGWAPSRVVELAVGAFDQQVVVHRPQHRPEAERIVETPRAAGVGGVQAIGDRGGRALGQAFEHPIWMARLENGDQPSVRRAGLQRGRRGGRRRGSPRPPGTACGPSDREWIAVTRFGDGLDLVVGEAPARRALWFQLFNTGTFQMSSAYSRMARSDENQPTLAVLRIDERHQAF